ncbi:vWFA domain containing protein [Halalkaliarchaeum sp. AArc-CO]|uniref:vWA domain-containing protein n=1 Tax=unclassified Halalkaliarchaeum TaxID=2678344 RepID=UPI00217D9AED|nr:MULTISPECIES: vWA domain-containing protein [unclassified Halalkaliarchaeum]MDR5671569.1 vWA domain-containing protein [Halalkaliarchaeum sp. AArc-GB]UWG51069.1 vWFA domain containing protein [Halalkaliarchaeum sp. AArc-CO]
MTDKEFGLSRRKVLAGLGMVGVASAGAGLGTTAYFSDEESFEGNTLTAGEFDLKMDYRMTYRGGHGRLEELQQNYPNATFVDEDMEPTDEDTGVYLLDQVPGLDNYPGAGDWVRGANGIFDPETGEGEGFQRDELIDADDLEEALIRIGDVKPGDYGEVTFSTHLYDNPGYMWIGGALTGNHQNGYTGPEIEALEEMGIPTDDPDGEGQLADAIEAKIWYDDNCDNIHQERGEEEGEGVDVMLVIDTSGSMSGSRIVNARNAASQFIQNLGADDRVGLATFDTNSRLDEELTFDHGDVDTTVQGLGVGGWTQMDGGVDVAKQELDDKDRGVDRVIILLGDGEPNRSSRGQDSDAVQNAIAAAQDAKDDGITVITIGLAVSGTAQNTLIQMASGSNGTTLYYDSPTGDDLDEIYAQIAAVVLTGEAVIVEGTLREVMKALEGGIPLDANLQEEDRVCFTNSVTRCFGFEWELPTDVGNEVQTDSVEFAIGFAAEQCRHNDGETNPFAPEVNGSA